MVALPTLENLPLGFRFKPTDVELIDHYLRKKINGNESDVSCIKEVDICRVEPWDLPDMSAIKTADPEWFFFCPRDRKYPNGQRSNRATNAGYWKATGKDRTIKSRRMGLIGMKKTLVFYTGRAPKGQRTHWVIHEYRPTLQELDGTNPGQGAFVLCRLFKKADDQKLDEPDDGSHTDEVETNVLSPHVTNVSQEDVRSEPAVVQASPVSVEQPVEQHILEKVKVKTSDSVTSEAIMPDHSHSYSYGRSHQGSQVNEEMAHEVDSRANEAIPFDTPSGADSHLNGAVNYYDVDIFEQQMLYQMHMNQGALGMESPLATNFGDGYPELQFQGGNGRDFISDFLESVIVHPDDPISMDFGSRGPLMGKESKDMFENPDGVILKQASTYESGSCSGSDIDVAQVQHDAGFVGGMEYGNGQNINEHPVQNYPYADDDDIFSDAALARFCNVPSGGVQSSLGKAEDGPGSNIQLRSIERRRELAPTNYTQQGTASRRIRLQKNGEFPVWKAEQNVSSSTATEESGLSADFEGGFDNVDRATVTPHEDMICLADISDNTAAVEGASSMNDGQVAGTGIKIRTHLRQIQPSSSNCFQQGTAARRIRLQRRSGFSSSGAENDNAKPVVAEIKNLSEDSLKSPVAKPTEKTSSLSPPPAVYPAEKMRSFSSLSKGLGRRAWSVIYAVLIIFAFLFMACIGLWNARNAIVLSS